MFTILALKISSEGDKRKKLSPLAPRKFFFSKFCHHRRRFWANIENMISPDHVLYLTPLTTQISTSKFQNLSQTPLKIRGVWKNRGV